MGKTRFPKDDIPDDLWEFIEPILPPERPRPRGGRPPLPARAVFAQIVYRLRTGCPWKALPNGSTVHRRFTEWARHGVFREAWVRLVKEYDQTRGAGLDWCSHDGVIVKAPKGGTSPGRIRPIAPNPAPSATF